VAAGGWRRLEQGQLAPLVLLLHARVDDQ
jgi:hypothetical protein